MRTVKRTGNRKFYQMKKMKRMIQATMLALMVGLTGMAHAAEAEAKAAGSDLFDLSFAGGTPQKLVSEMERAGGLKLNALVPPDLADSRMPPMELRSVKVEDVFDSLNMLSRDSMQWIRTGGSGGGKPNVWVLARPRDTRKTQAFYVGHLLKKSAAAHIEVVQTTGQAMQMLTDQQLLDLFKGQPVALVTISPGERRL